MAAQIPKEITPFTDQGAEADGPHRGVTEANVARQTLAVAYRVSGTKHHFWWPHAITQDPNFYSDYVCPFSSITVADTWTEVSYHRSGSAVRQLQLPYRVTEGRTKIIGVASIVSDVRINFSLRLSSEVLLDAVATTDGNASAIFMPESHASEQRWANLPNIRNAGFWQSTITMDIEPTLPASRRVAMTIDAKVTDTDYALFSLGTPGTVRCMLHSLVLYDTYENV